MGRHALLVGVAEFDDPRLNRLNAPLADVEKLAALLRDPARGAFDTVKTVTSGDFQETRNAMLTAVRRDRVPDDLVLLYYSGHGILANGELYFATRAIDMELPEDGGIAAAEVRDWLNKSRAGKRIVLLDCCHSGAFPGPRKDATEPLVLQLETLASPAEGQYVLTASDRLQYAYDATSDGAAADRVARYSRFTSWLIEAIDTGSAAPLDEKITVGSLRDYVVRRAREDGGGMRPQEFSSGQARDLVIARNPLALTAVIPSDVQAKLQAEGWEARIAAVIELTGYLAGRNAPRAAAAKRLLEQRLDDEWDRRVHLLVERALIADAASSAEPPEAGQPAPAPHNSPSDSLFKLSLEPPAEPPSREEVWSPNPIYRRSVVGGLAGVGVIGGLAYLASDRPSATPDPKPAQNSVPEPTVAPRPAASMTAQSPVPAVALADWAAQRGQDVVGRFADILVGGVNQRLRWLPPGRFNMGSPFSEWGRNPEEGPQRQVTLTDGFWLFETPCTQALWQAVTGTNPSRFRGPDHPVDTVSFEDVGRFLENINAMVPGLKLELPSEARWEYATRAGTTTATYNGDLWQDRATQRRVLDPVAWWLANSGRQTHPVGQKQPNAWGLKDVLGNLWEWCADNYHDSYTHAPMDGSVWLDPPEGSADRVLRGGCWNNPARDVRSACRSARDPTNRDDGVGFRCARVQ